MADPGWWNEEHQDTLEEFREAVNMSPKTISDWLETEESREVGAKKGGGESVGHRSGRRIVRILQKNKADYTKSDAEHMATVVGYVHRHLAQRPDGDIHSTPWRYSLMNWGHDPTKG